MIRDQEIIRAGYAVTGLGLSLVLVAACCHAAWNFLVKKINAGPELLWLFSVVALVIYLPFALYILVVDRPHFGLWQIVFMIGSAVLHLGYFLLLQRGYRQGDLSLVYPIARATGPLLSGLFAVLVLGEALSPQVAIGALAVIGGVLLLTGGIQRGARHAGRSLAFGLGVGLFIGTYTVWDAHGVATLMVPPLIMDYATMLGRVLLLTPMALRRSIAVRALWRDHRAGVIGIAVLSPLAYILVLYAMTFTPVVYVAPLREVSVLISVVLGSWLLGEGEIRRRLLGGAVILAGVVTLATG